MPYNSWFCITHHIALTVTRDIKCLLSKVIFLNKYTDWEFLTYGDDIVI